MRIFGYAKEMTENCGICVIDKYTSRLYDYKQGSGKERSHGVIHGRY